VEHYSCFITYQLLYMPLVLYLTVWSGVQTVSKAFSTQQKLPVRVFEFSLVKCMEQAQELITYAVPQAFEHDEPETVCSTILDNNNTTPHYTLYEVLIYMPLNST